MAQRGSGRGAAAGGGGTRSPAAAAAFPQLPAGVTAGTGSRLGKEWEASTAGRREGLEGRRHPASPQQIQLSFERGPRLSQLIPAGGTSRNPAAMHRAPAKGSSDTHGDTLLSGRFVGSNFPVQTGIYKLLCIDYIYPAPFSSPDLLPACPRPPPTLPTLVRVSLLGAVTILGENVNRGITTRER